MDWMLAEAVVDRLVAQWQSDMGDDSSTLTGKLRIASASYCNPGTATNNVH